ncbi:unnamed protein product [Orchesella dallaii]|uniref:TELO2-interacting protein 1 n=1 Tax=Orchesella dallaii TaxID=48710 RepID=A0ABP1QK91_9HEXA
MASTSRSCAGPVSSSSSSVKNGGDSGGDDAVPESDASDTPTSSFSLEQLKRKMEQESVEFEFLKPICGLVLQNPSEQHLSTFEDAIKTVGKVPVHLSEYVTFPFAIHLKIIRKYKESERIKIFKALSKLLKASDLRSSFEMFKNVFEKLHVALLLKPDSMEVNKQISEEELECVVTCIHSLTASSLGYHMDTICEPDNVKVFGFSIYILLQLLGPDMLKRIRLKTLEILENEVNLCEGKPKSSQVLFNFLPGIISALRKICLPSAGQSVKSIILKSLHLMGATINVCLEFKSSGDLDKADGVLSQIVELLSADFVLNEDADYRKSYFDFCRQLATDKDKLPKCSKAITSILLRMKEDDESAIAGASNEVLDDLGAVEEIKFEDLSNLLMSAGDRLKSGNDTACILSLKEAASILSSRKLSFLEFQTFLPLVFQFVNEMVWKFRNTITVNNSRISDPVFVATCRVCCNLASATDLDEIMYEFTNVLSEMQNNPHSISYTTGVIVTFNNVLSIVTKSKSSLSEFEAANIAEIYLTLVDKQSTEITLQTLASDIPAVQSAAEMRRMYLLEGLGILGSAYPNSVIPIVLYPLIEHAGSQNSEAVNEAAELALKNISSPIPLDEFLNKNLDFIISEVSVRMLNLILYPNCPNALVFLADYFDFSNEAFSGFIDQVFERCSDVFGGGNVEHIYVKIYYALIRSISRHFKMQETQNNLDVNTKPTKSLQDRLLDYQKSVGINLPSDNPNSLDEVQEDNADDEGLDGCPQENDDQNNLEVALDPVRLLVLKISHRVLNFLPNNERSIRLTTMDCLILGVELLKTHENSVLPLAHTIWQNLVPRFDEKDYVVVRKSFELLQSLCKSCGTFLKKRTIDEAFPRLSSLLLMLAKEGEQVKNKNRQYYTYTQAYKLQLCVLQGMGDLLAAIDVQEFELDKIVSGCILYLKPNQHKNLRDAATKLLESVAKGKHCRTVWMKLIANGLREAPAIPPHPSFTPVPQAYFSLHSS